MLFRSKMFTIEFKVKTISNCLIGNQTESFSIGGVDQATTVDVEGFPIIHGSAIKGCLRNITCTISTLSNWCWRIIPRVSRPYEPASERKHGVCAVSRSGSASSWRRYRGLCYILRILRLYETRYAYPTNSKPNSDAP